MTLSFSNIPSNFRVPLFYFELDPSHANNFSGQNQRTLILGQKVAAGIGVPNVARICSGVDDAIAQGGAGSMLALMVAAYRKNDPEGELWCVPLSDDGAAVAATGSITFTAQATAAGTLATYVGDVRVPVAVTASMAVAALATAVATAINANTNLPVTAAPVAGAVNLTAKNAGLSENDIPLAFNVGGAAAGEATPTGLAATFVQMNGGTTNPVLTTALANLLDSPYDFVIVGGNDATTLDALKDFFNNATGRWSYLSQVMGHGWVAAKGSLSTLQTLGAGRNDAHVSIMGENASPTPHWLWAPAYCGAAAVALRADPGRPVQTLAVQGIKAPALASRFATTDRNTLLFTGISTFTVADDGTVQLENVITTYQKNGFSQPDDSFLEVETLYQLISLLRDLKGWVTSLYPRMKLARDGTRLAPGVNVVTPSQIKGDLISHYEDLVYQGRAQDAAGFAANIIVEKDPNSVNRVNVLWPATVMDQLREFATLAQFRL